MKLRQPSRGTNAASFLPFLISCTRTHFRIAELGCFASIPLSSHECNFIFIRHRSKQGQAVASGQTGVKTVCKRPMFSPCGSCVKRVTILTAIARVDAYRNDLYEAHKKHVPHQAQPVRAQRLLSVYYGYLLFSVHLPTKSRGCKIVRSNFRIDTRDLRIPSKSTCTPRYRRNSSFNVTSLRTWRFRFHA